jgi:ABC-type multidrug transport system permease subunit
LCALDSGIAYFFCKTVVEVPLTFAQILLMYLISYFMMGLQGNFMLLVLATFGLSMVSNSLAMILGCAVADGRLSIPCYLTFE